MDVGFQTTTTGPRTLELPGGHIVKLLARYERQVPPDIPSLGFKCRHKRRDARLVWSRIR